MPPKQKVTKEILLEHAYAIAEESGIQSVTSRSVAKRADCSIQPVFSHFATMEELRKETIDYTRMLFDKETLAFEQYPDFHLRVALWMFDLARNRKNLYRMVYLSDFSRDDQLTDLMMSFQVNERMLQQMLKELGLPYKVCFSIFQRRWLLLYGIATLICVDHANLSDEQALSILKRAQEDTLQGAGNRINQNNQEKR